MARDAYLTYLPVGTSLTGNLNGTAIDLLPNTWRSAKGLAGVNLMASVYTAPLKIFLTVASVTSSGTATLTFQESDDNSTFVGTTPALVQVVTAPGDYQLSFTPTKEFQRVVVSSVTGTIVCECAVGVREH